MSSPTSNPFIAVCTFVLFAAVVSAVSWWTHENYSTPHYGEMNWNDRGMSDFHNGTYYLSMAFRDGVNPYSYEMLDTYPISRESPIYMPFHFIVHQPLTYLDRNYADVIYFGLNVTMLLGLSWFAMRASGGRFHWVGLFGIASLLVVSRPGFITLFTGYFTLEMVLGTLVALHFARTRPFLAGVGMLFAAGKPTYILPLAILMICRRNFTAVFWGLSICCVVGSAGLIWLSQCQTEGTFSQRMSNVIEGIQGGHESLHKDETELPLNTWTRTDIMGMAAKFIQVQDADTNLGTGELKSKTMSESDTDSESTESATLDQDRSADDGSVSETDAKESKDEVSEEGGTAEEEGGVSEEGANDDSGDSVSASAGDENSAAQNLAPWVPDDKMYLIGMLGLLIIPGMAVYFVSSREAELADQHPDERHNPEGAAGLSAAIILLTMLVSIYHHSYDCLLVVVPWVAITFYNDRLNYVGPIRRFLLMLLLAVPAVNYVSTRTFRMALDIDQSSQNWQYITIINGTCLTLALLILIFTAFFALYRDE